MTPVVDAPLNPNKQTKLSNTDCRSGKISLVNYAAPRWEGVDSAPPLSRIFSKAQRRLQIATPILKYFILHEFDVFHPNFREKNTDIIMKKLRFSDFMFRHFWYKRQMFDDFKNVQICSKMQPKKRRKTQK